MELSEPENPAAVDSQRLFLVVPPGINAAAVRARKALILKECQGLDPLRAEQFAVEAEQQQYWHDHAESRATGQLGDKTEAERLAATIADAIAVEPSTLLPQTGENSAVAS